LFFQNPLFRSNFKFNSLAIIIKKMKSKIKIPKIFLFASLLFANSIFAQSDSIKSETLFSNDAIYGAVGIGPIYFTAMGYYEHKFNERTKKSHLLNFGRIGFGSYALYGEGGKFVLAEFGLFTGAKKAHFETAFGLNYYINGDFQGVIPAVSIGFRHQKPGGKFIFRTGLGLPEAVYIGIGFGF